MRILIIFFVFLFFAPIAFADIYQVNARALGMQMAIQQNRLIQARQRLRYSKDPLSGIQYPTSLNPYPNIQRTNQRLTKRQRYSARYFESI